MEAVTFISGGRDPELSFSMFIEELGAAIINLVPEVRPTPADNGIRLRRGVLSADVVSAVADAGATVILRHGIERAFAGNATMTPEGLNDLAADLVGFFCGASLVTLSICTRPEQRIPPRPRRRRPGPYDAPLIPLPFEPRTRARR